MISSVSSNSYINYASYSNNANNANNANLNNAKSTADPAQNNANEQAGIQTTIMNTANKMDQYALSVLGTNLNIQA